MRIYTDDKFWDLLDEEFSSWALHIDNSRKSVRLETSVPVDPYFQKDFEASFPINCKFEYVVGNKVIVNRKFH